MIKFDMFFNDKLEDVTEADVFLMIILACKSVICTKMGLVSVTTSPPVRKSLRKLFHNFNLI
jgi:hypothetical protein